MCNLMIKFEYFFTEISFLETESLEDGSDEAALWMGRCAGFLSNFVQHNLNDLVKRFITFLETKYSHEWVC